jgi:hypothetical protein
MDDDEEFARLSRRQELTPYGLRLRLAHLAEIEREEFVDLIEESLTHTHPTRTAQDS